MSTHYCLEIELANLRLFSNEEQISAQFSSCIIFTLWSSKVRKVSLPHYNFSHISYVRGWGVSWSQSKLFQLLQLLFCLSKYWPHSVRLWRDASPSKERWQRKSKAGRPREADQGQGHRPLAYVKCVCLENMMVFVLRVINSKPQETPRLLVCNAFAKRIFSVRHFSSSLKYS